MFDKKWVTRICACVGLALLALNNPVGSQSHFPYFSDEHTAALWLFDERHYAHTTLTDATEHYFDLRLLDDGEMVSGRFGRALATKNGPGYHLCFAEIQGKGIPAYMRAPDGVPSGLWGPTITPEALVDALAEDRSTLELWLKLGSIPNSPAVLLDIGWAYDPGFQLSLGKGAQTLKIENAYRGVMGRFELGQSAIKVGTWRHLALVMEANRMHVYIDGKVAGKVAVTAIAKAPLPRQEGSVSYREFNTDIFDKSEEHERFRRHRFNLALGEDRRGGRDIVGAFDEIRVSSKVRYDGLFKPVSFSRNEALRGRSMARPSGPKIIFPHDPNRGPLKLGARKHLFIDKALVDHDEGIELTINPPRDPVATSIPLQGDFGAVDIDGRVHMIVPRGYGADVGKVRLFISDDGVNFDTPDLGLIEFGGSKKNNLILLHTPMWATAFEDLNPLASADARFKMTGYMANRGIYMFLSPDGLHWRRNETIMAPLISGGNAETYWDDQNGRYATFLKRDSSYHTEQHPGSGRRAVELTTQRPSEPWSFEPVKQPYYEGWSLPALTGEGSVVFGVTELGQVYRTRPTKYPWAPDVWLAFLWRMGDDDERETELAVSRDGKHWRLYGDRSMYYPNGWTFKDMPVREVVSQSGLIRREDEIWQYYVICSGPHGQGKKLSVRATQRLDGFVSLDAGTEGGTLITHPLVFTGDRLEVNARVDGELRFEILDADGQPVPGFKLEDCTPIQGDSVQHIVSWRGRGDISGLANQTIRLKISLRESKLFALQFTSRTR